MQKSVENVKRAMVRAAMAEGYENEVDIITLAGLAIRSIGKMTVAGYKATDSRGQKNRKCRSCSKW